MGYFHAAFVFVRPPDWSALADLPDDLGLRGYKYRQGDVWLLDFWRRSSFWQKRRPPPEWPFTEGREYRGLRALPSDPVIDHFERLGRVLAEAEFPGGAWLRLTLAVARRLRQQTFFFAADDEEKDFAAYANAASVDRIACRIDQHEVRYSAGRWTVTPRAYVEDQYRPWWSPKDLERATALPGVQVTAPRRIDGGEPFNEFPVTEWPPDAGDPQTVLGIGTWDPCMEVERDFQLVFER